MSKLEELKEEANELGVKYAKTIGEDALSAKIEEFYESKETSGPALEEAVKTKEAEIKQPEKANAAVVDTFFEKRKKREAAAKVTRVVTIIDNDQRVNNNTTTCIVSCGNAYFDLGTKVLPLNEKVEVRMGHINTLKEVKIPLHVRNAKTGLSSVKMRNRYSISFEG
jgi:hypothetical protein